jgi:hypothetical protein
MTIQISLHNIQHKCVACSKFVNVPSSTKQEQAMCHKCIQIELDGLNLSDKLVCTNKKKAKNGH